MSKIYVEYGLDFDNNRFGLGKSVEIESVDGTEYRTKTDIKIVGEKSHYFRLWVFSKVFIISNHGLEITAKDRNNFKAVFGISGKTDAD